MMTLNPAIDRFLAYPAKPELIGYETLKTKESLTERMAKTVSLIRQAEKRYVIRLDDGEYSRAQRILVVRDRLAVHLSQQAQRLTQSLSISPSLLIAA